MKELYIESITYEKYRECIGYIGSKFGQLHIASFGRIADGRCVPAVIAGRGVKRVLCFANLCDARAVVYGMRFFEKLLERDFRDEATTGLLDRVTFVFAAADCPESKKLIAKACGEIGFAHIIKISDGDF